MAAAAENKDDAPALKLAKTRGPDKKPRKKKKPPPKEKPPAPVEWECPAKCDISDYMEIEDQIDSYEGRDPKWIKELERRRKIVARRVDPEEIVGMLELLFDFPASVAADITGCEELELTEAENAKMCQIWTPWVKANANFFLSRAGMLIMPLIGTAQMARHKIMVYVEWRRKQNAETKK